MHRRSPGRLVALIASAALLVLVAAPAALAKEGVSVNLVASLPRDAEPGTKVVTFFTMSTISDHGESPLVGTPIFIRLFGPTGSKIEATGVMEPTPGLYKALIEIPAGGVARAEFGIHGTATDASGKSVASDIAWPYDGVLVSAAAPPPPDPKMNPATGAKPAVEPRTNGTTTATEPAAATGPGLDPRLAIAATLGLAALVGGAILGRRRRWHGPTTA